MTTPLPLLTDQELARCLPDDEAGFGSLATEKGHLPLKAMEVHAAVEGLLAQVTVRQTFVNTLGEPLEATYMFPLPDRAAVTAFRMEVAGRVIEGLLKERGQARKDYDQAIQAGHRAAITEEERPGVFTLRVGNLMPDEEAMVRLTLAGPLPYSDGEATFRFPLVVAPRYIPGTPLPGPSVGAGTAEDTDAVPDASRITPPVLLPGYPYPVQLSLTVDVQAGALPIRDFRSSLHAVAEEERGRSRRITLHPGERLDRDFILRFRLAEDAIVTSLALHPDAEGKAGTFLLTLVPPADRNGTARPRDVVFVLDRSGSMGGWKMVAARRALARMVDTLTDRDRFTVYAFDEVIETPPGLEGLVAATDRNRFRAVEFLSRIDARGGTEMAQPLERAVQDLSRSQPGEPRDPILVLITDGQVGHEDQILRKLAAHVAGLRIFTLGIDQAVNAAFLRRLAALGGGSCELVESEDRLDEVMDALHRRIATPVLTKLKLEPAGLRFEPDTLVPSRLPDLFAGAPLFLLGRYTGEAKGSISLQAADAAGQPWAQTLKAVRSENPALPSVWARGQVRELEDRYAAGRGNSEKLSKQIVDTSLKYGVLCRFTAYVAVDKSEVVNPGGKKHEIVQPVEAPAGWEMLRGGTFAALSASLALRAMPAMSCKATEFALEFDDDDSQGTPASKGRPPAASAPSSPGILGRVFRRKASPPMKARGQQRTVDLTAYRRRAAELLEHLRNQAAADTTERVAAFGFLAGKLTELLADLQSIGAELSDMQPLEKLLAEVRGFLSEKRRTEAALAKLWAQAEAVLQAFSGLPPASAGPDRRESFWK
jgi:Ca-activated chloride channel family protein